MDHVDCIVVGAGVVGLAVARELALSGRDVLVIEATRHFGSQTSSRNSEVVHAGIYYAAGSLKARHCVEGRQRLYHFARSRSIPHRICGKLIVAADAGQTAKLEGIEGHGRACGVGDLRIIDGRDARRLEPALLAEAALQSPSTGIIDSHAFMTALAGDIENAGSGLAFDTSVERIRTSGQTVFVTTRQTGGADGFELSTSLLVNAAGLSAQSVAARIDAFPEKSIPRLHLAKGNYFSASGRTPFSRLIYPVPVDGGLGVHLTFDLGGQMRFGPDVEWIESEDYAVDPTRSASFYDEIRRYWPALPDGGLQPAYCGVRPKLSGPGSAAADFVIDGPEQHGVPGIVNLFGIESPGLTASLSIAAAVAALAGRR